MSKMRLQLTWYNKDMALIPTEAGRYGYRWVDPADPRYCETHACYSRKLCAYGCCDGGV